MNQRALQDLIDQYLLGQISPENKKWLLDLMEADPAFARQVRESEETFHVLQLAKERRLRQKLKEWDTLDSKHFSGKRKGLLFLLGCLLLVMAISCWIAHQFSPSMLAQQSFERAYQQLHLEEKMMTGFQPGIEAFRQKDFDTALLLFTSMPKSEDAVVNSFQKWNILLCRLGLNGPSDDWLKELESFSGIAPEPLKTTALRLIRKIHSPFYVYGYRGIFHKTVTSIKPKII